MRMAKPTKTNGTIWSPSHCWSAVHIESYLDISATGGGANLQPQRREPVAGDPGFLLHVVQPQTVRPPEPNFCPAGAILWLLKLTILNSARFAAAKWAIF